MSSPLLLRRPTHRRPSTELGALLVAGPPNSRSARELPLRPRVAQGRRRQIQTVAVLEEIANMRRPHRLHLMMRSGQRNRADHLLLGQGTHMLTGLPPARPSPPLAIDQPKRLRSLEPVRMTVNRQSFLLWRRPDGPCPIPAARPSA